MLLAGLLAGRGWAVPVGALAWGLLLLLTGTIGVADLPLAALLGGLNTAVGVIVRRVGRMTRRRDLFARRAL